MNSQAISKYAKLMSELGYFSGGGRLLWKENKRIYATRQDVDLSRISDEDIEDLTEWDITEKKAFDACKNMKAMVVARPPYCMECIKRNFELTASLEDMAQIIGYKVTVTPMRERELVKAFRRATGVFVSEGEGCAITVGRNPYEAYVAMTVLEKNAEVNLKAEVLGGAVKLSPVISMIERLVYVNKYSKTERKRKDEEG